MVNYGNGSVDADLKDQIAKLPDITFGLTMWIYCRKSGISPETPIDNTDTVLAVFVGANIRTFPVSLQDAKHLNRPVFYVINRHMRGEENDWVAYPTLDVALLALEGLHPGYMFSGKFIYTSDGRKPFNYPIPVHDRSEK